MPSCFCLYPKGSKQRATLQEVDRELCKHLGVPCSDENWVGNWYNTIGLSLAIGHSLEKTREFFPESKAIIDYLEQNYDSDAWWEGK